MFHGELKVVLLQSANLVTTETQPQSRRLRKVTELGHRVLRRMVCNSPQCSAVG